MVGNWGEVVTRYPYRKVGMDHLLSKEFQDRQVLNILGLFAHGSVFGIQF